METLTTPTLVLEPLTVAHADAMAGVLSDVELYRHLDYGPPPSLEHLRDVYRKLEARRSEDGRQIWLNWIVRLPGGPPIGYVQATVVVGGRAWIAYLLARAQWGRGHACGASAAMVAHLQAAYGVVECRAMAEAANLRSIRLLGRLGFRAASAAEAAERALTPTERLFVRRT